MEPAAEPLWMRHEFPWLGSGFIHPVADDYATEFADELESLGCRVYVLRGESMREPVGFWNEINEVFGFPSYSGANWDAFNDSFRELEIGARTIVMWRRADLVAASMLKLFVEAVAILHETGETLLEMERKQFILVVSADDESFPRPTPDPKA